MILLPPVVRPARLAAGLLLVLASALQAFGQEKPAERGNEPGRFDFYVLALSWSPSYCASAKGEANAIQCARRPAYRFVVHGLWPQFERGYPKDCQSGERRRVPREQVEALADIMPGGGLVGHEWRTHGICSGLSQGAYFATVRRAYEAVRIPDGFPRPPGRSTVKPEAVERAFLAANPGMPADGISIDCDRRYLREVRICLTKQMRFRSCREVDRASCRRPLVDMPLAE